MQVSNPAASPKNKILTPVANAPATQMSPLKHTEPNGCELTPDESSTAKERRKICLTHHLTVCHCGWPIGFHEGENSKTLTFMVRSQVLKVRWAKRKTAVPHGRPS